MPEPNKITRIISSARTPLIYSVDASIITGTLDGDRLPAFSSSKKGAVPATGAPSGKYLRDDGTWATSPGGMQTHGNEYHSPYFAETTHNHDGIYEPADANIQTHITSAHAPSNAQKNSDITKAEIEAKLTGEISSHSHAGGGQAFPVGSVFLAVVSTNPATLLGYGTWTQIAQGQFLVGQKTTDADFDVVEETGGAKTHTHANHPALTHSGAAVDAHPSLAHSKITGTKHWDEAGADSSYDAHASQTHTVTQPSQHAAQGHDNPSHLPPYYVVYLWRRDV